MNVLKMDQKRNSEQQSSVKKIQKKKHRFIWNGQKERNHDDSFNELWKTKLKCVRVFKTHTACIKQ